MGSLRMGKALVELQARFEGRFTTSAHALETASRDFGGLVRRRPVAIVRPRTDEDVLTALCVAADHGLSVSVRGAGHSQSGHCVGGDVVLDMRELNRIVGISQSGAMIEVEGGARWKEVVDAAFVHGRLPVGLTHVLDTTVAGTLCVGGVGAEAFRVGPQVDNPSFLDVATPDGRLERCSLHERRELFDAVRAGLGQCGVVVRVGYPVRSCRSRVQSRWFIYRDLLRFMTDVDEVTSSEQLSFVTGLLTRDPENPEKFVLLLVVGREFDELGQIPNDPLVSRLQFDHELPSRHCPLWLSTGIPGHIFFRLFVPSHCSADADPTTLHPWVDHVFDRASAKEMLDELLTGKQSILSLGTNALIFIKRRPDRAPLFVVPHTSHLLWGVGMFPSVRPGAAEDVVPHVLAYARRGQDLGGKRYLSGFLDFKRAEQWSEHYGPEWSRFRQAKSRFDPKRILNPGLIAWE